jgi:hypothetical protein
LVASGGKRGLLAAAESGRFFSPRFAALTMNAHLLAMPVLAQERAGLPTQKRSLVGAGLYGTAFPLGGTLLLTADHVISNAEAVGEMVVGIYGVVAGTEEGIAVHADSTVVKRWPEFDLAALEVSESFPPLRWSADELPMVSSIFAAGYGMGYSKADNALFLRGFSGTVVTGYPTSRIVGRELPGRPWIYETSFTALPGLSGSALLARGNVVVGCIIGNSQSYTVLDRWQEDTEEDGCKRTTEVREVYSPGIAIQSKHVLTLKFDDGSTVRDKITAAGGEVNAKIPRVVTYDGDAIRRVET